MRRRLLSRAAGALLVFGIFAGCSGDASTTTVADGPTTTSANENVTEIDTSVVITITSLAFPAEVTVPSGKAVTWVNESSMTGSLIVEA